jgi:hypothetical protein
MKKFCFLLVLVLASAVAASFADDALPPKTHPDSSSWQNLFADDLSDAIYPEGIWFVEDGALTASEDQIIWTKKQYGDCLIDLEFKTAPAANSGVFIYGSDLDNWVASSVEVQILDDYDPKWAETPATWHCGGIFGRLAPTKSVVKKPGEWNRMTITCRGPIISVLLNGEPVTEMDMRKWTSATQNPDGSETPSWLATAAAKLPTNGHIGLQGKHGGAPIYFRNLKIKPLSP